MRSGRIEPRGSGMVRFVFAPLEAREYAFPLTVAMRNDDGIVVRQQIVFYGVGYHPSLHDVLPWTTAPPSTASGSPSASRASAPAPDLYRHFGITAEAVADLARHLTRSPAAAH